MTNLGLKFSNDGHSNGFEKLGENVQKIVILLKAMNARLQQTMSHKILLTKKHKVSKNVTQNDFLKSTVIEK